MPIYYVNKKNIENKKMIPPKAIKQNEVFLLIAICLSAKRIVLAKRKTTVLDRKDRLYTTLMLLGLGFLLIGMIIMVLPIEATFYVV